MSEKDTGFAAMAGPAAEGDAPRIGVGMLGYAFMGKAHTNGFKKIPYMMYPPPAVPERGPRCQTGSGIIQYKKSHQYYQ